MASHIEPREQFETRKQDHIRLSLKASNQAAGGAGFDRIQLIHEALPEIDFSDIDLSARSLGVETATPFLISSMTAGHADSIDLNVRLAKAAGERGWRMGVGSQRKELGDAEAAKEWAKVRKAAGDVILFGNLGIAQLIHTEVSAVEKLVDSLEAAGMIIHLNALQECLQPEGTTDFKNGIKALKRLARRLKVPVIVKETGCGFSASTLKRLKGLGLGAVDISGFGGTHWGRIEGDRNLRHDLKREAAATFKDWGISTVESMAHAARVKHDYEIWASGGVRTGLDAAKLLAMGADMVGFAMPILEAALKGEETLRQKMATIEFELRTALFCTGCRSLKELRSKKVWEWRKS